MTNQQLEHFRPGSGEDPYSFFEFGRLVQSIYTRARQLGLLFLVAAVVGAAYLFNAPNTYELATIVAVEETFNPINPQEALLEFKVSNGPTGLVETRKALLTSYSHTVRVLRELGWEVQYQKPKAIGVEDVYRPKNYRVVLDRSHPQLLNTDFELILHDEYYELSVSPERGDKSVIVFDENSIERVERALVFEGLQQQYSYGEWVRCDFFSFKVLKEDLASFQEPEAALFHFSTYNEQARRILKKSLRLETNERGKSSLMTVFMKGENREQLADFLNATIGELRRFELEQKNVMAVNSIQFIDEQLENIHEKLEFAESELRDFRSENLIVNLPQESSQILDGFASMDKEFTALSLRKNIYEHTLAVLESERTYEGLSLPSFSMFNDPTLSTLTQELMSISAETQRARLVLEPSNPTRRTLERELEFARSGLIKFVQNALSSTNMLLAKLESRMQSANVKISNLPATEQELLNIQREYQVWAGHYEVLLEKRAEAQLIRASNVPDTKVLETAENRQQPPVAPRKSLVLLAVVFFGFVVPSSAFVIKDFTASRVTTPDSITKMTSLPYLGMILHNPKGASSMVVKDMPKSQAAESFRSLRASLPLFLDEGGMKDTREGFVLGISSSVAGEGKTYLSLNLASALAAEGHRVLLVGGDLRAPRLQDELNLHQPLGLSSILSGACTADDAVQESPVERLQVITSGEIPPNPAELLSRSTFNEFIQWSKSSYDYILFDTAPINLVSDVVRMIPKFDLLLFVFRSEYSELAYFKEVNRYVSMGLFNKVGMVLNDVDIKKMERYGYKIGYAGYGNTYYKNGD